MPGRGQASIPPTHPRICELSCCAKSLPRRHTSRCHPLSQRKYPKSSPSAFLGSTARLWKWLRSRPPASVLVLQDPRLAPIEVIERVAADAFHIRMSEVLLLAVHERAENGIVHDHVPPALVIHPLNPQDLAVASPIQR